MPSTDIGADEWTEGPVLGDPLNGTGEGGLEEEPADEGNGSADRAVRYWSPTLIRPARLGQGCAAAAFSRAAGTAVAGLGGSKRTGRVFGGYGGAKNVGYLLGPLAGGAIVYTAGYRTLFATTGAVAAGGLTLPARRGDRHSDVGPIPPAP